MERGSVTTIVQALNGAEVRYLIAGGLAVAAHGYVRFTADVDLLIALDADNVARALRVFEGLGYRPRVPVALQAFADPAQRAAWVRDRHMTVFSLFSPNHAATEIDVFVEAPVDFEAAWVARASMEVAPGVLAAFVGRADLLAMKRKAGRPLDLTDIDALEAVEGEGADGDRS
ncbi:MAG: hypothetical protein AB7I25_11975 [Vicinamibacterales bacterium]